MVRTFLQTNSFPFVGCIVHYQVIGRGPAKLTNFTGTSVFQLKEVIKEKNQLPLPPSRINLWVRKPDEEKKYLDELRKAFKKGKSFDSSASMKLMRRQMLVK